MRRLSLFALIFASAVSLWAPVSMAAISARSAMLSDLQATVAQRACLRNRETRGKSQPYIALNDQGSGAKGAYQYMDGTWKYVLTAAEKYYGVNISSARDARSATPLQQDTVTAFAVSHPDMLDHRPWPYCY